MIKYKNASFPPAEKWDSRLSNIACENLQPVTKVHQNDWFEVYNRGGYFTVEYPYSHVIILPVIEEKSILMVRAKRPVINDSSLELPAGCAEKGEKPVVAAARELTEETGISIADFDRFIPMPPLAVAPNRVPKLIYVFRVDLIQQEYAERLPHDHEIENVECVSFNEAVNMISKGEIYVTVPMAVIGSYLLSKNINRF
jgi:8-oxo-dGTP pyrophosphatase MutT (NUDIX family)